MESIGFAGIGGMGAKCDDFGHSLGLTITMRYGLLRSGTHKSSGTRKKRAKTRFVRYPKQGGKKLC
jgi:hypothetical protein